MATRSTHSSKVLPVGKNSGSGGYCDAITSGAVSSVDFLFGCPVPILY
jgi:hypothetical protein